MATQLSEAQKQEHLKEMIRGFGVAMLATRTADGTMRARPLALAESGDDGSLYFATAAQSGKVHEVEMDPNVALTMQDGRRFISVTGRARVVDDRTLVDTLWSESWRVWFPQGKDDPSLRILIVEPTEATYWDGAGIEGLEYVFEMVKGYVTGTRPPSDSEETHTAHVKLQGARGAGPKL